VGPLEVGHGFAGPAEFDQTHPERIECFIVAGPQVDRARQRRRRLLETSERKQSAAKIVMRLGGGGIAAERALIQHDGFECTPGTLLRKRGLEEASERRPVPLCPAATFCHIAHSVASAVAAGRGSGSRGGSHMLAMISLRRLNNQAIMVNADLIESLESTPDTVVTLTSGNKLLVRDSMEEIQSKIIEFKRQIYGPKEVQ
jgi:flagellar protein FlbD